MSKYLFVRSCYKFGRQIWCCLRNVFPDCCEAAFERARCIRITEIADTLPTIRFRTIVKICSKKCELHGAKRYVQPEMERKSNCLITWMKKFVQWKCTTSQEHRRISARASSAFLLACHRHYEGWFFQNDEKNTSHNGRIKPEQIERRRKRLECESLHATNKTILFQRWWFSVLNCNTWYNAEKQNWWNQNNTWKTKEKNYHDKIGVNQSK